MMVTDFSTFKGELQFTADFEARRRLPSASSLSLTVRRTRLYTVGDRAFPVAAARTWNSLPRHVTSAPSTSVFRVRLKNFLSRRSFPIPSFQFPSSFTATFVVPRSDSRHFGTLKLFFLLTYLLTYLKASLH